MMTTTSKPISTLRYFEPVKAHYRALYRSVRCGPVKHGMHAVSGFCCCSM